MNKIVLIGNGFDIAHGLKTRYADFVLWYINKIFKLLGPNSTYNDNNLISIEFPGAHSIYFFDTLADFDKFMLSRPGIEIKYKNSFVKKIFIHSVANNWVDIEMLYYEFLKKLYKAFEVEHETQKHRLLKSVIELNECLEYIKNQLIEYLSTLEPPKKNSIIQNHISDLFQLNSDEFEIGKVLFLNFNYTSTINIYSDILLFKPYLVNYIHGKLDDPDNPIIFGYGDEREKSYKEIEQINENLFLMNFKSFGYFKTFNYQEVIRFIEEADFQVSIMGHSCGLSDRILLSSIFEHENCKLIKIHFHYRKNNTDDFFEKTQEISRHFDDKSKMRQIILPKTRCSSLAGEQ